MVAHFAKIEEHLEHADEKIKRAHQDLPPNIFDQKAKEAAKGGKS